MPKHTHADLMLLYAQDAAKTDKPWELWEVNNPCDGDNFFQLSRNPGWEKEFFYRRIPEKTDLEKYSVEKGDVWGNGSSRFIVTDANVGVDSFRDLHGHLYSKSRLCTLMFRRGVVDKL